MKRPKPVDPNVAIAHNVRRLRKEHGWTQVALNSRIANFAGVDLGDNVIRDIERPARARKPGEVEPVPKRVRVDELLWLAFVLDVSPACLLLADWDTRRDDKDEYDARRAPANRRSREQQHDERGTKIGSEELDPYSLAPWFAGLAPLNGQNADIFHENVPPHAVVVSSVRDTRRGDRPQDQVYRLDSYALGLPLLMAEFLRAVESKNLKDVRSLAPALQDNIGWVSDLMAADQAKAPSAWSRTGASDHTPVTQDAAKPPQT